MKTKIELIALKKWHFLVPVFVLSLLLGCGQAGRRTAAPAPASLVVFCAAGVAPAMRDIGRAFAEQTGVDVMFNFANAGVLAHQLEAGGQADVFLSANAKWMDYAQGKGVVVSDSRFDLLKNRLVIIVPKGHALGVDLSKPYGGTAFAGRFSMGDPKVTPLGIYAKMCFEKLGWWQTLETCSCIADTAPKALSYVELNEADAGVMFESIARGSQKVEIVATLSETLHKPIVFPVARCTRATPEAATFLDFLTGEKAREIFNRHYWRMAL
jgi:molybdate transport system substrate-binding protein